MQKIPYAKPGDCLLNGSITYRHRTKCLRPMQGYCVEANRFLEISRRDRRRPRISHRHISLWGAMPNNGQKRRRAISRDVHRLTRRVYAMTRDAWPVCLSQHPVKIVANTEGYKPPPQDLHRRRRVRRKTCWVSPWWRKTSP